MIRTTQIISDKFAMGLSGLCLAHCLVIPAFFILFPNLLFQYRESELIHYIILGITLPVSLIALILGLKNHAHISFFLTGVVGLSILMSAVFINGHLLGESGEQFLTLIGSLLVVFAHFRNYQTCRKTNCSCHEE